MEKLLVVGVDTIVGANVALAASDRCRIVGATAQQPLLLEGIECRQVPLNESAALAVLVEDLRPERILYCGSLSASAWDLPSSDAAWQHEPQRVRAIVGLAQAAGAKLTVMLTDAVFAGPRMFHEETSPAESHHPAAAHALAVEKLLADTPSLVVRAHAYGWAPAGSEPGSAERMWQSLSSGGSTAVDGQRYSTPILASDLADLLLPAWQLDLHGLLHLTGAERTSPARMACEMAAAFGLPAPRGRLTSAAGADQASESVSETSLSSRRARRRLEIPLPMLREGLQRFAEQAQNGWRERSRDLGRPPQLQHAA